MNFNLDHSASPSPHQRSSNDPPSPLSSTNSTETLSPWAFYFRDWRWLWRAGTDALGGWSATSHGDSPLPLDAQPVPIGSADGNTSSSLASGSLSSSSMRVSDSNSIWENQNMSKEEIWLFAMNIGVIGNDQDDVIISRIQELEYRDKESSRKKEASNPFKWILSPLT